MAASTHAPPAPQLFPASDVSERLRALTGGGPLHSNRESHRSSVFGSPSLATYQVNDGKPFCTDFVCFIYLESVEPGDGGLLVVRFYAKHDGVCTKSYGFILNTMNCIQKVPVSTRSFPTTT